MRRPLCCICMAFVATVFLYLKLSPPDTYDCAADDGKQVTLFGEVYRKEYKGGRLVLYLKDIKKYDVRQGKADETKISGVMCYIDPDKGMEEPKLGSVAAVEGKVSCFDEVRNPGGFDARTYYRTLGIDYRLYRAEILAQGSKYSVYHETLYKLRRHFEGIFDSVLPEKDASVMKAMVLGSRSELDQDSKQLYQKSGIAHVFAISGLHITIIGMGLYKLLRKLRMPQPAAALLSVCVMIAYGDMAGMSSSAYRAVFMFGMKLAAELLGRTYDMLTALAVAAVLILAEQPLYLYHSGFLLSFGAILGIGCLSDVVKPNGFYNKITSSLCGSLSIFLIHFPIMLCVYYEFPVYSFLLNLVVIPAMTFVMAAGLGCLAFGSLPAAVGLGLAKLAGGFCHLMLSAFEWLCTASLKLPFADWIVGRPDNWRIVVFFAAVLFLYAAHAYGNRISKSRACEERGIHVGLTFPLKGILILAAVTLLSDRIVDGAAMTFVDVGQGDCIWVESAKGEHFLIDGGSSSESGVGEYTIIPYLKYMGVARLDAVFLTHLDSDHTSGVLELLEGGPGIDIGRVCISEAVIEDEAYEELVQMCGQRKIPLYRLRTGDSIEAYHLRFEVLHPSGEYQASSRNAYSLVMKLTVEDIVTAGDGLMSGDVFTALLTGDVEADGEQAAAGQLEKLSRQMEASGVEDGIDVYKAAHHGSRYSNTEELIAAAEPEYAVISCGEGNSYGHPHAETLARFQNAGSNILITEDTGAIMFKIKDGKYMVKTMKVCNNK